MALQNVTDPVKLTVRFVVELAKKTCGVFEVF